MTYRNFLLIALLLIASILIGTFIPQKEKDSEYNYFVETQSAIDKAIIAKNYGQAEIIAKQAFEKAEQERDAHRTVVFLAELAGIYVSQDRNEEAEASYRKNVEFVEEKNLQTQSTAVSVYYDFAIFYYRQKRCDEAIILTEKFLKWQEFKDGTNNSTDLQNGRRVLEHLKKTHCQ